MRFGDLEMPAVPANIDRELSGRATAMPATLQHEMESRFATDLSSVHIYVSHLPTLVGAEAFTHGSDIHFAPGSYNPYSNAGQQLLGHELAHVVQQTQGLVAQTNEAVAEAAAATL